MTLSDLIAALEKAEGPSRELDLSINLTLRLDDDIAKAVKSRRGFDSHEGMSWEINHRAIVFQTYNSDGQCFFNGSYPLPAYTASIDAALSLVKGMWSLSHEDGMPFARVMVANANGDYVGQTYGWANAETPALALCIAALKAHTDRSAG